MALSELDLGRSTMITLNFKTSHDQNSINAYLTGFFDHDIITMTISDAQHIAGYTVSSTG